MRLPLLVDGGGMVFDGSVEVRPVIEEACNSCVLLCEDMDDFWRTNDSWVVLMTESLNGEGIGITGYGNSFLFELLPLLLNHWLSRGVLCEDLDECWRTYDSLDVLMTELLNAGETDITSNDNLLLFEWKSLLLKHRLSQGVVRCLPLLFPVPLLWQLTIPLGRGMMNTIWFCGDILSPLFFFDGHQKVRANVLTRQLQSCLSLRTRNKYWLHDFCLNIILIRI